MEELIKEVKWLYFQIENTQEKLVKSRLRNEEDNKHTALIELETEMCATLQLLKCILERKDNIVDLGEVWHDITEPAERNGYVLLSKHSKFIEWAIQGQKIWGENICKGAKYAYLEDLLPKGGEAWNTTK